MISFEAQMPKPGDEHKGEKATLVTVLVVLLEETDFLKFQQGGYLTLAPIEAQVVHIRMGTPEEMAQLAAVPDGGSVSMRLDGDQVVSNPVMPNPDGEKPN